MTLEETQQCCLNILKRLDAECGKLGLSYYLLGGSALGAIRHGGFIPWDDDIDVGLLRRDYDALCKAFCDDYAYSLMTVGKTSQFYSPYAKLCDNRTLFNEPSSRYRQIGVFVDIFPLDYVKDSDFAMKRALWKKRFYYYSFTKNIERYKQSNEFILKKIARIAMSRVYLGKNPAAVIDSIESEIMSDVPAPRIMNFWGTWGVREIMPTVWLGEGQLVNFEDMKCRVPNKWNEYLTTMYGDYMTPPDVIPNSTHGMAFRLEAEEFGDVQD